MAVLTGDLIDSRSMHDTAAFIAHLKALLGELGIRYGAQVETFRGDGFQLVMPHAQDAFDCAVAIRAGLIAASPSGERWDARIALGLGHSAAADQPYGEAFVLSGKGLDGMKKETFCVFSNEASLLRCIELPTAFLAALIDRWTPVEAQTYFLHLTERRDQQAIAEQLGKSRVTVTKALQRADARLVDRYLATMRTWIEELQDD
ncbi:hypothetical protein N8H22_10465 [Stutzerimonas stutzeri]|uniref:hypothetical protein n=1 Tax=Stutzerimonas sp. S1 TaxID=3030652 RepID=UPI0022245322|nr:hypothetical protein [Stutzerimonas sp. S1]MCW3149015.1 hypothetical protein [Stutzerimonas sp. S1]